MPLPIDPLSAYEFSELAVGSLSTLFAALSAIAAWRTVKTSSQSTKEMVDKFQDMQISARQSSLLNRTMQTILHCNLRYHDLEKERLSFLRQIEEATAHQYATRYWSLKSDQFDYWLAGFVDPDSFVTWFSSVAKHFSDPKSFIEGHCYRHLWISIGREYHRFLNPWFVALVDSIEHQYPAGYPIDDNYTKLLDIISAIEGIESKKGVTWSFREEFQKGMSFPEYKVWSKDNKISAALEQWLWSKYELSCDHPKKAIT